MAEITICLECGKEYQTERGGRFHLKRSGHGFLWTRPSSDMGFARHLADLGRKFKEKYG
jgi:hypothetical protein